ncbi:MAG: hypothetical protein GKR90_21940 [Pseudomonadales bacterium]|nr:hypothetical protein [Pseudomonadales bacterium]
MTPQFSAPYDWNAVTKTTQTSGAAILSDILSNEELSRVNDDVDAYLAEQSDYRPTTSSGSYNDFLGHNTIRLHGLLEKLPSAPSVLFNPELLSWVDEMIAPIASNAIINAGELIQIQPGEPRQAAHRDSDSWPMPLTETPCVVNVIFALDDFTLENGATWIVPNSWSWPKERRAAAQDYTRAVMKAGDAIIFRGDLIHRGGANSSTHPRRAISISYCAGWLRTVESSFLNLKRSTVQALAPEHRSMLGFSAYDGEAHHSGMLGLYENGDPARWFDHS